MTGYNTTKNKKRSTFSSTSQNIIINIKSRNTNYLYLFITNKLYIYYYEKFDYNVL